MMKIKVLLFAQLKEACGAGELWLDLPSHSTIQEAFNQVMTIEKRLVPFKDLPLRYAVNEAFQPEEKVLCEGDTLALLSPVAGG